MNPSETTAADKWVAAYNHLKEVDNNYTELASFSNVNVNFVRRMVIAPLLMRYLNGERTDELYGEMLAVE